MEYTEEDLLEAERQIGSTIHKLQEVVKTLEAKGDPERYKSQITLAKRRVAAFTLAEQLIVDQLERQGPKKIERKY